MFIYRSTVIKDNFKEKKKRKEGREVGKANRYIETDIYDKSAQLCT